MSGKWESFMSLAATTDDKMKKNKSICSWNDGITVLATLWSFQSNMEGVTMKCTKMCVKDRIRVLPL